MHRNSMFDSSCELAKKPYGFVIHADQHYKSGLRCEFFITPPPLRVLSFKGGVSRTFVYRAVLEYLEKNGLLSEIEEIGGSSSGCNAAVFSCIPYKNPCDRIKAMDAVADSFPWDIMRDTAGWNTYKTITTPLDFISNTAEAMRAGIDQFTNEYLSGSVSAYPFKILSQLFNAAAFVTSPYTYAALYNIATAGGIYHAELIQAEFRDQIQAGVQAGLESLLEKQINRNFYIKHLQDIGLCSYVGNKLQVTPDVTFYHLSELAKIPESQFKECYLTSTKVKNKKLAIFNKDNTPHMPIHAGCRLVITFPVLFTNKDYLGEEYFDGGIVNNAPVDLASDKKLSDLYESFGVTDKLARLNIRVEYSEDYEYHLWRKRPEPDSLKEKISDYVIKKISLLLTRGEDSYANDAIVTQNMQNDYAQRTLQLRDFGISQLGSELTSEMRDDICHQLMPDIEDFFNNHFNERIITNYELSYNQDESDIPDQLKDELLKFLLDQENKPEDIFDLPGDQVELNNMRNKLINSLSMVLSGSTDKKQAGQVYASTASINKMMGFSHDINANMMAYQNEAFHHDESVDHQNEIDQGSFEADTIQQMEESMRIWKRF